MQHRLAAAGASHPRVIGAALVGELLPQRHRKQLPVVLAVELPDIRIAIGVWAVRASEITGIDDRDHDHQGEFFGAGAQGSRRGRGSAHRPSESRDVIAGNFSRGRRPWVRESGLAERRYAPIAHLKYTAPDVNPAPKAASTIRSPYDRRPSVCHSERPSGIVAATVLP